MNFHHYHGGNEGGGEAGGLAFFSPWGNVVMYYDSFSSYPGLYILGEAIEGVEQVKSLSGIIHGHGIGLGLSFQLSLAHSKLCMH